MKIRVPTLFFIIALTAGCSKPPEQGRTDQAATDPATQTDPATKAPPPEEKKEEPKKEGDGPELDVVDNWVVWPGEHSSWVSFESGNVQLARKGVTTEEKTLVCNKPGTPVKGAQARVKGRWKYAITNGVGRVTVRFFSGDQPLKKGDQRQYADLSIGRDTSPDWVEVDQWVNIPQGADNMRYCTELKGSDGTVWSDDLQVAEWK